MTWTHAPAGVLTDMDGTLVDSTALIERHWSLFLSWYDVSQDALPNALHGKRAEEHVKELVDERHWPEAIKRKLDLEEQDTDGVVALPGAAAVLAELDEAGIPWAMVTSGTAPVVRARLEAAFLPQPKILVSAEDVPVGKPDPAPYLEGRRRLNIDGPMLALEDAPVGIESARGAGCSVAALTTTHALDQLDMLDGDVVVRNLSDLRVKRANSGNGYVVETSADLRMAS